jgi:hypothetical protein
MVKSIIYCFLLFSSFCYGQEDEIRINNANKFIDYLVSKEFSRAVDLFDAQVKYLPDVKTMERTWEGVLLHSGVF